MTDLPRLLTITLGDFHGPELPHVLASLQRKPYCCPVQGFAEDPDAARTVLLRFCSALGRLRHQNLGGGLISEVRSGGDGPQRGARTTNALLWHTDSISTGPRPRLSRCA